MREIKFRAKELDTGKWCVGSIQPQRGIVRLDAFWTYYFEGLLDKKTLGEFTGLKDKNCVEIYEGDIVEKTMKYNSDISTGKVIFRDGKFEVDYGNLIYFDFKYNNTSNMMLEVIGNIHEDTDNG